MYQSPPAGSAKEQKAAMKAAQVHALDAARAAELAKQAYTLAKQRRRDDEVPCLSQQLCALLCTVALNRADRGDLRIMSRICVWSGIF